MVFRRLLFRSFYNRKLRRLVAVELKVGEFKAAFKGQMELYLRWLDKHEREPEEASPLGIILCTGKKRDQIEWLELEDRKSVGKGRSVSVSVDLGGRRISKKTNNEHKNKRTQRLPEN